MRLTNTLRSSQVRLVLHADKLMIIKALFWYTLYLLKIVFISFSSAGLVCTLCAVSEWKCIRRGKTCSNFFSGRKNTVMMSTAGRETWRTLTVPWHPEPWVTKTWNHNNAKLNILIFICSNYQIRICNNYHEPEFYSEPYSQCMVNCFAKSGS